MNFIWTYDRTTIHSKLYREFGIMRIAVCGEQHFGAIVFGLSGIGVVIGRGQYIANVNFIRHLERLKIIIFAINFRAELVYLVEFSFGLQIELVAIVDLQNNRFYWIYTLIWSGDSTVYSVLTCVMDPITIFSSTRGKHMFLYSLSFSTLIRCVASSTNRLCRRAYLHSLEKLLENEQRTCRT